MYRREIRTNVNFDISIISTNVCLRSNETKTPSKQDRVYYASFPGDPNDQGGNNYANASCTTGAGKRRKIHYFSIDDELIYWNFFLDFGPLNLGHLYRFCVQMNTKIMNKKEYPLICFYSSCEPTKRANAVFLICAWQVLYLNRSPEEAYNGFRDDIPAMDKTLERSTNGSLPPKRRSEEYSAESRDISNLNRFYRESQEVPLIPFHDASPGECTYILTIMDCLRGLAKARKFNFFDYETFNVEEYEYFEQVENGDFNWIIKDKILAFAGPHYNSRMTADGYCTLTPGYYIPYFRKKNVGLVIRLNKKCYEEQDFIEAGIDFSEHYYLDGSCPPPNILQQVLRAMESTSTALTDKDNMNSNTRNKSNTGMAMAIHCKAGLGRTGTCIGAYLMKHYKFTAAEAIGWMRICRPGMVIGPQQHFLQDIEQQMWHEGDLLRLRPFKQFPSSAYIASSSRSKKKPQRINQLLALESRNSTMKSALPSFDSLSIIQKEYDREDGEIDQGISLLMRRNTIQQQSVTKGQSLNRSVD